MKLQKKRHHPSKIQRRLATWTRELRLRYSNYTNSSDRARDSTIITKSSANWTILDSKGFTPKFPGKGNLSIRSKNSKNTRSNLPISTTRIQQESLRIQEIEQKLLDSRDLRGDRTRPRFGRRADTWGLETPGCSCRWRCCYERWARNGRPWRGEARRRRAMRSESNIRGLGRDRLQPFRDALFSVSI